MRKWLCRLFGLHVETRWHVLRYRAGCWEVSDGSFPTRQQAMDICARRVQESRRDPRDLRWCVAREIVFETRYGLPLR